MESARYYLAVLGSKAFAQHVQIIDRRSSAQHRGKSLLDHSVSIDSETQKFERIETLETRKTAEDREGSRLCRSQTGGRLSLYPPPCMKLRSYMLCTVTTGIPLQCVRSMAPVSRRKLRIL